MNGDTTERSTALRRLPGGASLTWGGLLFAVGLGARLATLPRVPDVDDSFLFIRGVERFSIAETRPHWPGYPVYIWAGKAATALMGDPVLALHVLSALACTAMVWPLASIARGCALGIGAPAARAERCAWAAAALWLSLPVAWVTGSQIVSDPLGLLCGVAMLALCIRAERREEAGGWLAGAALGGVMIGVRLVNVTMMGPLLWKAWASRRQRGVPGPAALLAAVAAGIVPWLAWLVAKGPRDLLNGAERHTRGHFTQWGHSMVTDPEPWSRPWRALRTLAVYGLGAGTPAMGPWRVTAAVAWLVLTAIVVMGVRRWRGRALALVAAWAVPHLVYVVLAHDVGFPRYMLSAAAVVCMIGGLALAEPGWPRVAIVVAAAAASAVVSVQVALLQQRQAPAEDELARWLRGRPASVAVVDVPGVGFAIHEIAPGVAWADSTAADIPRWHGRWVAEGREVYATALPPDPTGWRPVAHFCRDPLIDPRRGRDIWLFAPASTKAPPPFFDDCGG